MLNNIVGQERAIAQLKAIVTSIIRGDRPNRPALLHGPSGVGKSLLAKAAAAELRAAGWTVHEIESGGTITTADQFNRDLIPLLTGEKVAVFIDECQALFNGQQGISPIVNNAMRNLVLAHGDEVQENVSITVLGENHIINFRNVAIFLLTNEPSSLESRASRAQGENPIFRRCDKVELEYYTSEAMAKIIPSFLARKGLRAHESSQTLVLNMHRGSMDPIKEFVDKYLAIYPDKPVLERERVLTVLRLTSYLPRGLKRPEGEMLRLLNDSDKGAVRATLLSSMAGVKSSEAKFSLAYLSKQRHPSGKPCPFITYKGSDIVITEDGRKYIQLLKQEKFSLA